MHPADARNAECVIPADQWTEGMQRVACWAMALGLRLLDQPIDVKIVREPTVEWGANYGCAMLTLNLGRLGHGCFDGFPGNVETVLALLLHEFGHEYESDHLSDKYHRALTRLGAKAAILALRQPECFPR